MSSDCAQEINEGGLEGQGKNDADQTQQNRSKLSVTETSTDNDEGMSVGQSYST